MGCEAIISRLEEFFADEHRGAIAVYVFGSVARGSARPDSDVDLGVLYGQDPPKILEAPQFALEAELERSLARPVQVVALNGASADLVHRVLRDGRIILDRDPAARIRFEVQRRNEYFDLAPIRRRYRRYPAKDGAEADRVAEPRR